VKDVTGKIFGRLKVLSFVHRRKFSFWRCQCKCGKIQIVRLDSLTCGHTQSCGCLCIEKLKAKTIHGMARRSQKRSLTYSIWTNMKDRCRPTADPMRRKYYADRGIKVCKRWREFKNFLADMGECPKSKTSIDRINSSKGYTPSNCRWADWTEQAQTRRPRRCEVKL